MNYILYKKYIIHFCIGLVVLTESTNTAKAKYVTPSINENMNQPLEERLKKHIKELSETIGPRNIEDETHYEKLCKSADYIKEEFQKIGYQPNIYDYIAIYNGQEFKVQNIEVVIPSGTNSSNHIDTKNSRLSEYILIGAHYDTVVGSPGADDNGSGVAALLEIGRYLYSLDKQKIKTTIKLVAFPNEESPYNSRQKTDEPFSINMGSAVYARQARANNDRIIGMVCLESIGYYSDAVGSQQYPPILKWLQWFYGNKGNFLVVVSNRTSKHFLNRFVKSYKKEKNAFTMHAQSLPYIKLTRDIGRSDHKSFWLEGYPAIMITDTANFRNSRYHTQYDTADSLSYKDFTKVTNQLCLTVEDLATQDLL